jgi:hypothetical protein
MEPKPKTINSLLDELIDEIIDKAEIYDAPHAAYEIGDMRVVLGDADKEKIKKEFKQKIADYLLTG